MRAKRFISHLKFNFYSTPQCTAAESSSRKLLVFTSSNDWDLALHPVKHCPPAGAKGGAQ